MSKDIFRTGWGLGTSNLPSFAAAKVEERATESQWISRPSFHTFRCRVVRWTSLGSPTNSHEKKPSHWIWKANQDRWRGTETETIETIYIMNLVITTSHFWIHLFQRYSFPCELISPNYISKPNKPPYLEWGCLPTLKLIQSCSQCLAQRPHWHKNWCSSVPRSLKGDSPGTILNLHMTCKHTQLWQR